MFKCRFLDSNFSEKASHALVGIGFTLTEDSAFNCPSSKSLILIDLFFLEESRNCIYCIFYIDLRLSECIYYFVSKEVSFSNFGFDTAMVSLESSRIT